MTKNLFLTTRDLPKQLGWRFLAPNVEYSLEFLEPVQALTQQVSRHGSYTLVAAEVMEDAPTRNFPLLKGERVILDLPSLSFRRAWMTVATHVREAMDKGINVRVRFVKKNKKTILITDVERVQATDEQRAYVKKTYTRLAEEIDQPRKGYSLRNSRPPKRG